MITREDIQATCDDIVREDSPSSAIRTETSSKSTGKAD